MAVFHQQESKSHPYDLSFSQPKLVALTAMLANAVGAAKVEKPGAGHNMPTLDQVKEKCWHDLASGAAITGFS
jgi:hypothetical protein